MVGAVSAAPIGRGLAALGVLLPARHQIGKSVNRDLEVKARALVGLNGMPPTWKPDCGVCDAAYNQLSQIEKSFCMSKSDLRARSIYHHKRDSIEARLQRVHRPTRWLGRRTDWSIKKLHTSGRRPQPSKSKPTTRSSPLPNDIRATLQHLHGS